MAAYDTGNPGISRLRNQTQDQCLKRVPLLVSVVGDGFVGALLHTANEADTKRVFVVASGVCALHVVGPSLLYGTVAFDYVVVADVPPAALLYVPSANLFDADERGVVTTLARLRGRAMKNDPFDSVHKKSPSDVLPRPGLRND